MAKNLNISKDREQFLHYYSLYLQHYGRKLSPKSYYYQHNTTDDKFAYGRVSDNKQYYNTMYNQRYRQLTPEDPWLTVISATCHRSRPCVEDVLSLVECRRHIVGRREGR